MKKLMISIVATGLLLGACSSSKDTTTTSSSSTTQALSAGENEPLSTKLVSFATFDYPIGVVPWTKGYLVAEKVGKLVSTDSDGSNQKIVLDISSKITKENEQGLLGLAVSPKNSSIIYVDYTDLKGDTNVVEYRWNKDDKKFDSPRRVLFVDQPYPNHNGGNLVFGPDGYLYIGMGDGGSGGDPGNRAQRLKYQLGKILRINPAKDGSKPYSVPASNPFVDTKGAQPEIYILGVRNPWRFTFDRDNGNMWIGDVGQEKWEEVDFLPKPRGANLGWSGYEADTVYDQERVAPDTTKPVYKYPHENGACSITGGYVYRGKDIPKLDGLYVYADYCKGNIWALQKSPGDTWEPVDLGMHIERIVSFGQARNGELFVMSGDGPVYRIENAN